MRPRHPLPRVWLMTDERLGDGLWRALDRLPRGAGIIFRHYRTPPGERRRLFARVRRIARARGLWLIRAGAPAGAGADGTHGLVRPIRGGLRSWPAHDRSEAAAGRYRRVDALFVSPVFATASHPDTRPLGPRSAARIGLGSGVPLIALGGMSAQRFGTIERFGFHGWAAIDAWTVDQKRKAVPI